MNEVRLETTRNAIHESYAANQNWGDTLQDLATLDFLKLNPLYDANALVIMAWTARFGEDDSLDLAWINDTLSDFITQRMSSETYRQRQLKGFASKKVGGLPLSVLLGSLVGDAGDTFVALMQEARERLINLSVPEIKNKFGEFKVLKRDSATGVESFIAVVDAKRILVGARLQPSAGIRLPVHKEKRTIWCDLYGVWRLNLDESENRVSSSYSFHWAQGVFIPVDGRHSAHNRQMKTRAAANVAAAASRNMSHNLGSHALRQVANRLRNAELQTRLVVSNTERDGRILNDVSMQTAGWLANPDNDANIRLGIKQYQGCIASLVQQNRQLADLLNYLNGRTELIAAVAGDLSDTLFVSHSVNGLFDRINEQELLQEYLCSPYSSSFCLDWYDSVDMDRKRSEFKGLRVDLRGAGIGAHAFFAILENFARNSAKHVPRKTAEVRLQVLASETKLNVPSWSRQENRWKDWVRPGIEFTVWDTCAKFDTEENAKKKAVELQKMSSAVFTEIDTNIMNQGIMEVKAWVAFLQNIELWHRNEDGKKRVFDGLTRYIGHDQTIALQFVLPTPIQIQVDVSNSQSRFALNFRNDGQTTARGRVLRFQGEHWETPFGTTKLNEDQRLLMAQCASKSGQHLTGTTSDRVVKEVYQVWIDTLLESHRNDTKESRNIVLIINDDGLSRTWGVKTLQPSFANVSVLVENENFKRSNVAHYAKTLESRYPTAVFAIWDKHSNLAKLVKNLPNSFSLIHCEHHTTETEYKYLLNSLSPSESQPIIDEIIGILAEAALTKVMIADDRISYMETLATSDLASNKLAGIARARMAGIHFFDCNTPGWQSRILQTDERLPFTNRRSIKNWTAKSIHRSLASAMNPSELSGSYSRPDESSSQWKKFLKQFFKDARYSSLHSAAHGGVEDQQVLPFDTIERFGFYTPCKAVLLDACMRGGLLNDGGVPC